MNRTCSHRVLVLQRYAGATAILYYGQRIRIQVCSYTVPILVLYLEIYAREGARLRFQDIRRHAWMQNPLSDVGWPSRGGGGGGQFLLCPLPPSRCAPANQPQSSLLLLLRDPFFLPLLDPNWPSLHLSSGLDLDGSVCTAPSDNCLHCPFDEWMTSGPGRSGLLRCTPSDEVREDCALCRLTHR